MPVIVLLGGYICKYVAITGIVCNMSSSKDIFTNLLKSAGFSVTTARLTVFEAFLAHHDPMSMGELVAKTPGVDRASVYRAVELFEQLRIIQRITTGWKYKLELSDRFTEHHHHLTCVRCERIIKINEHELEQFIDDVAKRAHFTPTAHQIEIQGVCEDCAAKQPQSA
jgi:Fur family transcriptional regulator, ferric uptake regulator